MIYHHRFFLIACLAIILPTSAFAFAPVVDDSENYALLDDQQAAYQRPAANRESVNNDEEIALANDSTPLANDNVRANSRLSSDNANLLDKVQGLQQEVQELRGQLEVQAHDLKLLQQQQLAFYKDLDARVRNEPVKVSKNTPTPALDISSSNVANVQGAKIVKENLIPTPLVAAKVNSTTSRINPADEQINYLAAYELVKAKKYDEAISAMDKFITKYPQGGYTANAQYWLGELYMVKKDYTSAIKHFEIVLQQFPSSSKKAASMLKIGYALADSGKKQDAISRLQQVVKNYPDTSTAKLAKSKLDNLNT
jgi:tol-pal system protein YbgF